MEEPGGVAIRLTAVVAILLALTGARPALAADEAILRIEPASVKAADGGLFAVRVVADSPVAASGAQASIEFDPTILQVESVQPTGPYASAEIVVPDDLSAVVRDANRTGRIAQVAAAFIPPASVAAGPAPFLVVQFRVIGCGETELGLPVSPKDAQLIDGRPDVYGHEVALSSTDGHVRTCVPVSEVTPTGPELASVAPGSAQGWPMALVGTAGLVLLLFGLLGGVGWRSRQRPPGA